MCNVTIGAARAAALFASVLAVLGMGAAHAQSATGSFGVSAEVALNCTIATTPVDFGLYDPIGAHATTPLDSAGSVTVACTRAAAPRITLSLGLNNAGSQRRMANGAEQLDYELYKPPNTTPGAPCGALADVWRTNPAQSLTPPPAPSNAPRTWNVCGRIPPGQNIGAGSYTDTVVATVIF